MHNNNEARNPFENAEVISTYSRNQAIEDGVLIDVSDTARDFGYKAPVVVTDHVHNALEQAALDKVGTTYEAWLGDVLMLARTEFLKKMKANKDARHVVFRVVVGTKSQDLWMLFEESEGFCIMFPEDY